MDSIKDDRDHVIYFIDGPAFTNIIYVMEGRGIIGEGITIYGSGGAVYPPRSLYGRVIGCNDPSDVDDDAGGSCFSIPVIRGDSGSAVYNHQGQILALITYAGPIEDTSFSFALNFTENDFQKAREYIPPLNSNPPSFVAPTRSFNPFLNPFSTNSIK
jgi:hypothetical protein